MTTNYPTLAEYLRAASGNLADTATRLEQMQPGEDTQSIEDDIQIALDDIITVQRLEE